MKGRNNTSRIFNRAWAVIAALAALLLLFCKVSGRLAWSWRGMALGYVWIMCSLRCAYVLVVMLFICGRWASKQIKEWRRRQKVARTLYKAMEGITLNSVGPIYGVTRKPGEQNKDFKRRILKAALTVDTVHIFLSSAGGKALDEITRQYGLQRNTGERDEGLRARILKEAKNQGEGKANGL